MNKTSFLDETTLISIGLNNNDINDLLLNIQIISKTNQ
jgi:hypothetical protein